MAFGFVRAPGTSRNYINTETGEILSRRQYDKFVDRLGKRNPGLAIDAIRDTERQLEALRASLNRREAQVAAREEIVSERERILELEKQLFRAGRQSSGQRRYNAALEAYVRSQRLRGRRINKLQARSDPAFKQALEDLKGWPNKRRSPAIADDNRVRRNRAMATLGGDVFFRDQYESLYGGRAGGHGVRTRVQPLSPRGRSDTGRKAV